MLERFVDFYCFALDTIVEIFCLCRLYSIKIQNTRHSLPIILMYLLMGTFLPYFIPDPYCTILLFPISYVTYKLIFRKNHIETLLGYLITYLYIVFIQELFSLFLDALNIGNLKIQPVIGQTGSVIIGIIFMIIVPAHKLYIYIAQSNIFIKFTIIYMSLLYMVEVFLSKFTSFDTLTLIPLLISFAVIVFVTDYLLIMQQQTITRQQESLASYETYEPMMDDLIQNIRRRQHDYANELNAIQMIACSHNDYDSLSRALNKHIDDMTRDFHHTDLIKLNTKVLAGFLYSKLETARKSGKDIDFAIKNYDLNSHMPEYELIKVVGILLDNALEATIAPDYITVSIDSDGSRISFATVNKGPELTSELRSNMVRAGYTTKMPSGPSRQKRGNGLANAKHLLDNYDGELYIENLRGSGDTLIRFEFIV